MEEIAFDRGIPIAEPFQGSTIGDFAVLAPSRQRYLDLIVGSKRTPDARGADAFGAAAHGLGTRIMAAVNRVRAAWGVEVFSPEETSNENDMSVVQYAVLSGHRILLTGDAGRRGLNEAVDFAPLAGVVFPGVDRFDVPHHGSRRNVSTEVLDRILGTRLPAQATESSFFSVISASDRDADHPRNAVVRALIHRGAKVATTEKATICVSENAPDRAGWGPVTAVPYPEEQEED